MTLNESTPKPVNPLAIVYIDPEARPSPDLVTLFEDQGARLRWICDYRELLSQTRAEQFSAIVVDMSSASPDEFSQRVQEARSIDLAAPSVAIVPPLSGSAIAALKRDGFIHHWVERPIDQETFVADTMALVKEFLELAARDAGTDSSVQPQGHSGMDAVVGVLLGEGPGDAPGESVPVSDLFSEILDGDDLADGPGFVFSRASNAKVGVAHQYRSMRPGATITEASRGEEEMNHYVLEEHVATGGMAELFKARLRGVEGFARTVAIKRILPVMADDEDFVAMFIDEARLASSLDHPNIVRTLDFGKCKTQAGADTYFIAMDFVEGKDLNWIIKRLKERNLCVPEPLITYIAAKVAGALYYLHTRTFPNGDLMGLVHRDISPHNIMISKQGGVFIVDFGVVKAASKINQTMDGNLKGKLIYMSPEQARGIELDGRSDQFSLGLVIHEALTMTRAYTKGNVKAEPQLLKRAQAADVPRIKESNPYVSQGLIDVVEQALSFKPSKRFPSAKGLESALKDHLWSLPRRVEEEDIAEFLAAVMDKDPSTLEALIQNKYPAAMEYSVMRTINAIEAGMPSVEPGDAPAQAPRETGEKAKKGRGRPQAGGEALLPLRPGIWPVIGFSLGGAAVAALLVGLLRLLIHH